MKTPEIIPSKDELERQKLALEIRELQRKWWQRPVYLSILLPIALASLTILAGILSGYFNRERMQLARDIEALKAEKTALIERETARFEATRASLKRWEKIDEESRKVLEAFRQQLPLVPFAIPTPTPSPSPTSN